MNKVQRAQTIGFEVNSPLICRELQVSGRKVLVELILGLKLFGQARIRGLRIRRPAKLDVAHSVDRRSRGGDPMADKEPD
jgi:hypothetical protein